MRVVTSFPRGALRAGPIAEPSEFYASYVGLTPAFSNPREGTRGKTAKLAAPHHHQPRNKRERGFQNVEERRRGGLSPKKRFHCAPVGILPCRHLACLTISGQV